MSPLLDAVRVIEVGGRTGAICGRLFAELGADVIAVRGRRDSVRDHAAAGETLAFEANKRQLTIDIADAAGRASLGALAADADLLILDLPPEVIDTLDPQRLMAAAPRLVVVAITPFGCTGPKRDYRASDLVTFHASGVARLLVGHVADAELEPPVRAGGEQSDFIVGITAATAAMNALYQQWRTGAGQFIDVSGQEAMSLMAARELTMPGFGGQPAAREGFVKGGSAGSPRLPTRDGNVAVSPRENGQWTQWLHVLGDPAWGSDPRFATRRDREANFAALYELMAAWSINLTAAEITARCQERHVPCFPFGEPANMLTDVQLDSRGCFVPLERPGAAPLVIPRLPFGLPAADYAAPAPPRAGAAAWSPRAAPPQRDAAAIPPTLPLDGLRVLDFSWVIAGPTSTRYMALMGAEVIKIESPSRPDTGRGSELHDVLGQSKLSISLDLKAAGALEVVHRLLRDTDVVVENFAPGVMERLGLGYDDLRKIRPDIVMVSCSGLGGTGPRAHWVAYGSLLSAYAGFLDEGPEREKRTGLAWADPLCGLLLDFATVAVLRQRAREGAGRHIDFSMLESLLWTIPGALIGAQTADGRRHPVSNEDPRYVPHNVYRTLGNDCWLAIAVTSDAEWAALCTQVPALQDRARLTESERREQRPPIDAALRAWARDRDPFEAMDLLQAAGVPASASYTSNDLFGDAHLWERGFYDLVRRPDGSEHFLPSLPWRWGDRSLIRPRPAPGQGQDTERVLRDLVGVSSEEYAALQRSGALGDAGDAK